jgi:hypothetical protein
MNRPAAAILALVTATATLCIPHVAWADSHVERYTEATLYSTVTQCERPADEVVGYMARSGLDGYEYKMQMQCMDNSWEPLCDNPRACVTPEGATGIWFKLQRRDIEEPIIDAGWQYYGETCVRLRDLDRFRIITPEKVWDRMKELDWPTAEIVVQPPGGRTLVNFRTNVYTELDQTPKTKLVRMYGVPVTIEASPVTYTWHWGDETDPETTDWPGAPVPKNLTPDDLDDLITHEYLDADVTVTPSVDVTYSGRFRIDDSEWIAIEQTLTLPGPAVDLEVIEARVHLVG